MSLYNDASLVMIPSAYKDGKLYSIKPTDGSGDFTFSRGSNLAATRVDENGLIEKGRENLLLQSNQFDTTWVNVNTTEIGGQVGYDGSSDAWLLSKSAAGGRIYQNITGSGIVTSSIYLKANASNWGLLQLDSTPDAYVYVDLINGVSGSTGSGNIDATITSVGGGWYRISVTANSTTRIRIYPAEANGDVSGTSGSIYIQDAQLEVGLVATDYIETTTTTAQAGILEDMPRLDYSGSCPSLLLEPTRTNLVVDSENYTSGQWGKTRSSVSANSIISPEGNQNAFKLIEDSSNNSHYISDSIIVTNSTSYTYCVFAKKGERSWVALYNNFSATNTFFDLENGVVGSIGSGTTASIEDYGNGWYRCAITFTSTSTSFTAAITICTANNTATYQGDGSSGIYIYGAMLESGSYPTSYIPCYGAATTRSADRCYLQSADVHSDNSGTMFFEVGDYDTATAPDGFRKIITANAVSTSNLDNIIYFEEYGGNNTILIRKNGSTLLQTTPSYQDLRNSKIAIKWSDEGAKVFINGALNKSYTGDASLNLQYFGHATSYSGDVLSTIAMKQRVHFPTALTDSECIALTTI